MTDKTVANLLNSRQDWQQVAFCAAISERMFPNFALFSELNEFGDISTMRQILDKVWDYLEQKQAKLNVEAQLTKVEANIPEPENFDSYGVWPALDAAVTLSTTLNMILSADATEANNIAAMSKNTVANFITLMLAVEELSEEEQQKIIAKHELMQQEQEFQLEVLELLQTEQARKIKIAAIKTLSHNQGYSNLGISK